MFKKILKWCAPLGVLVVLGLPAAGVGAPGSTAAVITYQEGGFLYRVEARPGAIPVNLTVGLDALSTRAPDQFVNVSPDGRWLLFSTERFDPDCTGFACLVVVAGDLSSGTPIRPGGVGVVHPEGFSAIASGGNLVVYTSMDGPHGTDIWAISRSTGNWGSPLLLTALSSHQFNDKPAIADNGASVLFDCGPVPFGQEGTGICAVATDASGLTEVLPINDPNAPPGTLLIHNPDFAPDGSIVIEIDTGTESIWRLPTGSGGPPVQVTTSFDNDNSPCVLPDGRIVSLWLNAPDNPNGFHEIKVMDADGSNSFRVVSGVDVLDDGMGCAASGEVIFADGFE